jgi:hypothetical protein
MTTPMIVQYNAATGDAVAFVRPTAKRLRMLEGKSHQEALAEFPLAEGATASVLVDEPEGPEAQGLLERPHLCRVVDGALVVKG